MEITDEPIIVEYSFKTPLINVWRAITELKEMRQWYFSNIASFKSEVGFETQFEVQNEDRKFTHLWKVTEVIPLKKITYNWKYKEYPGDSLVTFELLEENEHTKLKLLHQFVESFPPDIPEFKRESGVQGWHYFLGKNLKEYLDLKST